MLKKILKRIVIGGLAALLIMASIHIPQVNITNNVGVVQAASMKISKKKATILAGKSITLKVKGTSKKVTWKSSNKKVATVSSKGKVVGKKAGKATITAKVKGKTFKCVIEVVSPKLSKTKLVLVNGKSGTLKISGTSGKAKWTSSNKKVATVSSKGVVVAKKVGKATITAKVNGKTLKCSVVVENPAINKTKLKLVEGKSATLKVTGTTMKVTWSSSNKKVATVSTQGKVVAKKAGKATIIAKVNGKTMKCTIEVSKPDPMITYKKNFDAIVAEVKAEGDFSDYGAYLTYGYVSVNSSGDKIQIFSNHDREGHCVTIHRGSYMAEAKVELVYGWATATFDIRKFKGDASDMLEWDNNPSTTNAFSYNAAIAQVLKNVSNYNFYLGDYSFQDIGFKSYVF